MKKLFILLGLFLNINNCIYSQYFGRNKVKYKNFDFHIVSTPHFNIYYYYHNDSLAIMDATRMAERWYERYHSFFQYEFTKRKPIVFYAHHSDFQQTNIASGFVDQGVGGFTEGGKNRLVMPFTNMYSSTDHVLGHEMVHEFQYSIAADLQRDSSINLEEIPLFIMEGMAEYMSIGPVDSHTAMYLRDALLNKQLPTIDELRKRPDRFFPYRYGHAFWAFVAGQWGENYIPRLYRLTLSIGLESAIDSIFKMNSDSLSKLWQSTILADYEPLLKPITNKIPGREILAPERNSGKINLSPVLSPDGKYVAFLSEKSLFSIELYLADAKSGKIIKKLTETATDAHIDALNFIGSSGSWSPDGKKFIFTVFASGENEFVIVNTKHPGIERNIKIKNLKTLSDPSWSPDGKSIAFSGTFDGISNLYLLDLASKQVKQLTRDRYSDFQPTWSPDGKTIAFVTDRGVETDFNILSYADPGIAVYEMSSGRIQTLPLFRNGKNINPQFSPDGKSLFFISDQDGFIDIYRLSLVNNLIYRVTTTITGVSGITDVSQAMSVAANDGAMAFSVFENNNFVVYKLDQEETEGQLFNYDDALNHPVAAQLPPIQTRSESVVSKYLHDPNSGLASHLNYQSSRYKPKLSIDYLGQTGVGIGLDRFGPQVGGDVIAIFSDVLGNHRLIAGFQGNVRSYKDLGGALLYQNLSHRWQWGGAVQHLPIISSLIFRGQADDGRLYTGELLDRVSIDNVSGLLFYPLSTIKRLELNSGYTHYGFEREVFRYFDNGTADVINLASASSLGFYQGSIAYVGDYSYFGYTSPVKGGRYRFQLESTLGSLNYFAGLADCRRYIFFNPFTLAFRGLYYGRFGKDALNNIFGPLYLGDETFVRGYSLNSLTPGENPTGDLMQSGIVNRLIGNQIGIANVEVRFPLLGSKEFGLIEFLYLPTELAVFVDGGVVSNKNATTEFNNVMILKPIYSTGVSARVNLINIIVMEFFYVYPFQRPEKGWHFGFVISTGF